MASCGTVVRDRMKLSIGPLLAAPFSVCSILEPNRWPSDSGEIVLTFDDGPSPTVSIDLLNVLKKHDVKATFCLIGANVAKEPEVAKRVVTEGHDLAIHTFNHTAASLLSVNKLRNENRAWLDLVESQGITGSDDVVLFRPPFGIITPAVRTATKEGKFKYAYLTFFVNDAMTEGDTSAKMMSKIKKRLVQYGGGAIVLHEMRYRYGSENTEIDKSWLPSAVEDLIIWGRESGFNFSKYKLEQL